MFNLPYDVVRDFEPICLIASAPLLIVAKKAMPAADLKELIAWLKANPDKASQGTGGVGATSHVAGVFFQQVTGTRFALVPYRGAGPAMQDLVAGQIDMMIDPASNTLPQVRAGTHQGLCGHREEPPERGAGDPDRGRGRPARVSHLELAGVLCAQGHADGGRRQAQCRDRGGVGRSGGARAARRSRAGDSPREQQTPEALAACQKAEIEKWWPIIKAAGIKGE